VKEPPKKETKHVSEKKVKKAKNPDDWDEEEEAV